MRLSPLVFRTLACVALALAAPAAPAEELLLATTTSVRDSGLLDALLPPFSEQTGIQVRVVAVGTGAALRMGAEGNADVLVAHAPKAEEALVDAGSLVDRQPFMENHFVIAGPEDDPAYVGGAVDAIDAFKRIGKMRSRFASRGDDSGTHKRELALWEEAEVAPGPSKGWPDYASTGSGMGATLQVAGERKAYVLSDVGTFLAFQERIGLVVLSKPDDALRNTYSVLRPNPAHFPGRTNEKAAEKFAAYLVSQAAQRRIAGFGAERFGKPLFRPLHVETADSDL